jgi:hypothetical protein
MIHNHGKVTPFHQSIQINILIHPDRLLVVSLWGDAKVTCHDISLFTGRMFVLLFNTFMVDRFQRLPNQLQQRRDIVETEFKDFSYKSNAINLTLSNISNISSK